MGRRARPAGAVHRLSAMLVLSNHFKSLPSTPARQARVIDRRRRQRKHFVEQLVAANPGLLQLGPLPSGSRFWQALRWGTPWMLLGWCLAQAAKN